MIFVSSDFILIWQRCDILAAWPRGGPFVTAEAAPAAIASENRRIVYDTEISNIGWMMDATIHRFNVFKFNAYSWSNAFANDVDCRPIANIMRVLEGPVSLRRESTSFTKAGKNCGCRTAYWCILGISGHIWASYAVL